MLSSFTQKDDRVVGLDLSTNSIAFSLFVDGKLERYGEIEMKGEISHRNYLANRYALWLGKELKPDIICYEGATYVNNRKTVIKLAESYGAIVSSMSGPTTVVESVPPVTWQRAIGNPPLTKVEKQTIKLHNPNKSASWYKNTERQMRKERTKTWVKTNLGVECDTDNLSDAIAVGWWRSNA